MSVLRQGGSFLQRRLTQLYSDTKRSYESVTKASKAHDDPELVTLHRNFRLQKDRLLAWGLDWSDSSAAQPHDIDESLNQAGFSDVVASVMSTIQEFLNEAERMQHPDHPKAEGFTKALPGGFPSEDKLDVPRSKTRWTEEEISRSKELLAELTTCIDTLDELSKSRRSMTMSSLGQSLEKKQSQPKMKMKKAKMSRPSMDSFYEDLTQSTSPKLERSESKTDMTDKMMEPRDGLTTPRASSLDFGTPTTPQNENTLQYRIEKLVSIHPLYIDRNALDLSKGNVTHAANPPPYEVIAASANTRLFGHLKASALTSEPPIMITDRGQRLPVLVEFTPMVSGFRNSGMLLPQDRLDHLFQSLRHLLDNAKASHLGVLKFLGYFIDLACSRYAFVYQIPPKATPGFFVSMGPWDSAQPRTLVSFFQAGEENPELPIPNLEDRFRLAYNLILANLYLRSQDLVHGNINSSNVLIFQRPVDGSLLVSRLREYADQLRHPYLTSFAQLSDDGIRPSPEPLSTSMYRHPNDRRTLRDTSAWAYDLYSLGLILLEIGLWTPLSRLWKLKYNNEIFKSRIENVYVAKLGSKCGSGYLNVVQLCLSAPENDISLQNIALLQKTTVSYFPGQKALEIEDRLTFSKNYLYTVSKRIARCCSIDLDPPPDSDLEESIPLPSAIEPETPSNVAVDPSQLDASKTVSPPSTEPTSVSVANEKEAAPEMPISEEPVARKQTLKKWSNIEIPQERLDEWNSTLMPRLSKLLQKILQDSPESCSASLMSVGETPETAKTTICVTCSNVGKVRGALKRYFKYDSQTWGVIVLRGEIRRSKVPRKRRRRPKKMARNGNNAVVASGSDLNPFYQKKPLCGASIGAFRDNEHLPPVSYGGAVLVDGVPFGMTVHHMLDVQIDDDENDGDVVDEATRSAGHGSEQIDQLSADVQYSWCDENPPELLYPFEISEDETEDDEFVYPDLAASGEGYNQYWLPESYSVNDDEGYDDGEDDDETDASSVGDTRGFSPDEEDQLIVTQPAIDDVDDDFFPNLDDRDEEHLSSHSLGYVYASSGVRRWTRKGIKHEVDWALIKIDDDRMEAQNVIQQAMQVKKTGKENSSRRQHGESQRHSLRKENVCLDNVAKMEDLGGLQVHCCGRTSGLQQGSISKAMTLVKMYGRRSFSISWSADGNFGTPGDSGAWVFDTENKRLCGHILAYCAKNRTAFIAPMQLLFEDIARTLGATTVTLPDSSEVSEVRVAESAKMEPSQHKRTSSELSGVSPSQLPRALGRLSLNTEDPIFTRGRSLKDISNTYRPGPDMMMQAPAFERQMA